MRYRSSISGVAQVTIIGGIFFVLACATGIYSGRHVPHEILVPLLKYSIGAIGVIWLFSVSVYNKLSDITDISGLDFRQHRSIEIEIRSRLHWFWLRAVFLGLLALVLYAPTILVEAKISIPDWVFGFAFGALGLSLFSLRQLFAELEDIRQLKSYVKELERREKERSEQLQLLKVGQKEDWKPDPHLDGLRKSDDERQNYSDTGSASQ